MENRKSVRKLYETDVCVIYKDNFWHGTSRNIYVGGMFLESKSFPTIGAEIILSFEICNSRARIRSVVRWIGKTGFGVQFIDPSVQEVHNINKLFKDGKGE